MLGRQTLRAAAAASSTVFLKGLFVLQHGSNLRACFQNTAYDRLVVGGQSSVDSGANRDADQETKGSQEKDADSRDGKTIHPNCADRES